jgi:hypothetical protein
VAAALFLSFIQRPAEFILNIRSPPLFPAAQSGSGRASSSQNPLRCQFLAAVMRALAVLPLFDLIQGAAGSVTFSSVIRFLQFQADQQLTAEQKPGLVVRCRLRNFQWNFFCIFGWLNAVSARFPAARRQSARQGSFSISRVVGQHRCCAVNRWFADQMGFGVFETVVGSGSVLSGG